jgi:hypothetical protein
MERDSRFPVTGVGTVSLLMIWIVLCMGIFAALSLTTAARDYRLSQKLADHTTDYYTAASQAEETLAQVDALLQTAGAPGAITGDLSDLDITWEQQSDTLILSYSVPLGETQALEVDLSVSTVLEAGDPRYTITRWQVVNTSQWQGDNHLRLLDTP